MYKKEIIIKFLKLKELNVINEIDKKTKYLTIIRPFLNISRETITNLCKESQLPIFTDKTNSTLLYTRNRIRNKILPLIKKYINQNYENNIFHFTEHLEHSKDD